MKILLNVFDTHNMFFEQEIATVCMAQKIMRKWMHTFSLFSTVLSNKLAHESTIPAYAIRITIDVIHKLFEVRNILNMPIESIQLLNKH